MLCITVPMADGRFAMVVSNRLLSTSRHVDYAHYRFKEDDHPVLKSGIEKFVTLSPDYNVVEVIDAVELRRKGVSYRTATRLPNQLATSEIQQVSGAVAKVMLYEQLYDLRTEPTSTADVPPFKSQEALALGTSDVQPAADQSTPKEQTADEADLAPVGNAQGEDTVAAEIESASVINAGDAESLVSTPSIVQPSDGKSRATLLKRRHRR